MNSSMKPGTARALVLGLASWLVGCTPPEAATSPDQETARHGQQVEHDQRALERRLLQLETQALAELRKLRESRQASTGGAEPAREDEPATADCELLVFGGRNHETFLGCLNDEHQPDSVFNMLGEHGSHLSAASIRNKFSPYGSNHDDTSACNESAKHPPAVVASDGKSLGLLTVNASLEKAIKTPSVADWLTRMCGE